MSNKSKRIPWIERGADTNIHIFPLILQLKGFFLVEKLAGVKVRIFLFLFENNTVHYLTKPNTVLNVARPLLQKIIKDKNFIFEITKKLKSSLKSLLRTAKIIQNTDLSSKTDRELCTIYKEFSKKVINMMQYGAVVPILEWEESLLSNMLSDYLKEKIGKPEKLGEYLNILSTPSEEFLMTQEQKEIFRVSMVIYKNKKALEYVKTNDISFARLTEKHPEIGKIIKNHRDRFHGIYFNYEGPEKDENYFLDIIREILIKGDPAKDYQNLLNQNEIITKKKSEIIKELKIDDENQYLFRVAQELAFQKGYRKDISFEAFWMISNLVQEIASRKNLTIPEARSITLEEIEDVLINNKFDRQILVDRINLCAVLVENNKFKYISGPEAKKIARGVKEDLKVTEKVTELKGNIAFPGTALGIVKIIQRKEDMIKMSTGDILISSATNPELMPAIRKAAAIVTDEGGITCHAAIVSRELKIPCIVGTKIATKVLKDGDKIKVDANKGLIEILKDR